MVACCQSDSTLSIWIAVRAYVKMIDVETGRIIWQGEERYSGGDPRVRVLVAEDRQEELTKDLSAVARLLSDELVDTM